MFGDATTRLVSRTVNRIPYVLADIDDGYQLFHLSWSQPLTVDAVQGIRIKIPALRSHIAN
jgi:hypothetical protein